MGGMGRRENGGRHEAKEMMQGECIEKRPGPAANQPNGCTPAPAHTHTLEGSSHTALPAAPAARMSVRKASYGFSATPPSCTPPRTTTIINAISTTISVSIPTSTSMQQQHIQLGQHQPHHVPCS